MSMEGKQGPMTVEERQDLHKQIDKAMDDGTFMFFVGSKETAEGMFTIRARFRNLSPMDISVFIENFVREATGQIAQIVGFHQVMVKREESGGS